MNKGLLINNFICRFKKVVNDNFRVTGLSRTESTAIKGLLIMLVLLGHNKYLMVDGYAMKFLYSFHIYSFYFLPFLYNHSTHRFLSYFWKNLKRFYIPYLICVVIIVSLTIFRGIKIENWDVIKSVCTGEVYGTLSMGSFLWFLPTMFALLIFKEIYYRCSFRLRCFCLIVSGICFLDYGFGWFWSICQYIPFMIRNGIAMLLPGLFCRILFLNVKRHDLFFLLFLFITISDFVIFPANEFYPYKVMTRFIGPVGIFLFILSLRKLLKDSSLLLIVGEHSFSIYLVHIFIYNLFYVPIDKYIGYSMMVGILLFFVVLVLSYYLTHISLRLFSK